MEHKQNKVILGSILGLATLAVAIDHTRHSLPVAEVQQQASIDEVPCTMYDNPCAMYDNPCSVAENPCGLYDNPCAMYDNPCGLN